jgi:integrase
MPIREKSGKWQIRFAVNGHTYYEQTALVATERNRTAALRLEAKARELVLSGRANELRVQVVPFSEAAMQYLNWADGEYREHPASAKRIRTSFASLGVHFGKRPVNSITAGDVESYKAWRRKEHQVREVTLRHDLHALSGFFQFARKHGWLHTDPLAGVAIPSDADAVRMHVLAAAEEAVYFESARRYPTLYDMARLMLNQGCRPEEFLEMRKDAVDLERGEFRIVSGKSAAARRTLRMTPESREILARRMQGLSPWVFPSRKTSGHVLKVSNSHDKVLKQTGLSFVLYDLRHTFATRAAERGIAPAVLAAILGHGDIRSIGKYIHIGQDAMNRAMEEYGNRATPELERKGVVQ